MMVYGNRSNAVYERAIRTARGTLSPTRISSFCSKGSDIAGLLEQIRHSAIGIAARAGKAG
jgi:hypothetical protein